jgi:hypothetical protein
MWRSGLILVASGALGAGAWADPLAATAPARSASLPAMPATRPAGASHAPATRPATGTVGLKDACPILYRGTPFRTALAELADRLGVRYILDASIPAAILDEPVRMSALHLTGDQAFRWLARIGGVTAVLVDGMFLVAPDDRLPAVWRATGTSSPSQRSLDEARLARLNTRRADIEWVDAPLSGVAEDVSGLFGVDVIFHPALLADSKLIYLKEAGVSLEAVREALARQLGARTEFYDGALWVCPADEPPRWLAATSRPAETQARDTEEFRVLPLDAWVSVDRSASSWAALAAALGSAAGVPCSTEAAPGASYPGVEANGSVAEVLEGLRMLGLVSWNAEPGGSPNEAKLRIAVRQKP